MVSRSFHQWAQGKGIPDSYGEGHELRFLKETAKINDHIQKQRNPRNTSPPYNIHLNLEIFAHGILSA